MKKRSLYFLLTFSSLFFIALISKAGNILTHASDETLVVKTAQGKLKGSTEKGVYVWRGIRYALAPTDSLRFTAPQPVPVWGGTKEAVEFGPVAPQVKNSFIGDEPQSEDCLFLNIWSPAPDDKKRPVMVWIHGGGFEVGAGSTGLYNGANLAKKGDVVVVTVNYRLGVLGFLYFDDSTSSTLGFENNLGILDQIAALQWVKQNIAAFGGDPQQVTIFGESAGGTSVQTLLASPSARGLFNKAIAESGPAAILWQPDVARGITDRFLSILGVPYDSVHLLKKLPLDTLKQAQEKLRDYMVGYTVQKVFSPTIDGKLLLTDISACLSPVQSGNVALMIGTNKDESTLFASKRINIVPTKAKKLDEEFLHVLSAENKRRVIAAYPAYPRKRGVLDLVTDAVFRIPAIRVAECQSMHSPVYMYRFEWSSFLLNLSGLRSFHGLEIPFVFGNADGKMGTYLRLIATKKLVARLSGEMQQAWINFARYGNPNGNDPEQWKAFDKEQRATMIFDKKSKMEFDPDDTQRKAWEGISYY